MIRKLDYISNQLCHDVKPLRGRPLLFCDQSLGMSKVTAAAKRVLVLAGKPKLSTRGLMNTLVTQVWVMLLALEQPSRMSPNLVWYQLLNGDQTPFCERRL